MKKVYVTVIALGLFSSAPAAFASAFDAYGSNLSNTSGCSAYGCRTRLKVVGYAPEFQEALGLLQSAQDKSEMPAVSATLRAAISEHREKILKDGTLLDGMTDLQVVEDLVKSRAASAR